MADLDFPNNPVDGDKWTDSNGVEWEFKGYGWKEILLPYLSSMSDISSLVPNVGDKLIWNGEKWEPAIRLMRFDELTNVHGIPVADDYLVYDGVNFNPETDNNELVYAQMRDISGGASSGTENQNWFYFTETVTDTHAMVDGSKSYITIPVDGFYKVTAVACLQEGYPIPTPPKATWITCYVYNSGGGTKYVYENQHPSDLEDQTTGYYLMKLQFYENMVTGDYIRLYWNSYGFGRGYPVYFQDCQLSAHKVDRFI